MKAFFVVTTKCNFNCKFCYYNTGYLSRVEQQVTEKEALSILQKLKQIGINAISFTGGEPLLRKDIFELLSYAKGLNFNTTLVSNGSLISKKISKKIKEAETDILSISLNECDDKTFKIVSRGINNLRDVGVKRVKSTCVLTKKNYYKIDRILEFVKENRIDDVIFQPVIMPVKSTSFNEYSLDAIPRDKLEACLNKLDTWAKEFGYIDYLKTLKTFFNYGEIKIQCSMGKNALTINPDGLVYPCFYRLDLLMGNIVKDSISKITRNLKQTHLKLISAPCFDAHCIVSCFFSKFL